MKQFFNQLLQKFSVRLASAKPFAIALLCAFTLFVNATPALAFGNSDSQASKGLEQLDEVQEKSTAAITDAANKNGTQNVIKNAKKGLNGVQGAANKEDMINRSEANGETVEDTIQDVLEDLKP